MVLVALGVGIAVGAHGAGGVRLSYSSLSPDGRERLDVYHASRWRALLTPGADMPGFVRLVRLAGDETLGTSPTFELSGGGRVIWSREQVQLGSSASFDRTTGTWSVED
jgi:hypothetical protein